MLRPPKTNDKRHSNEDEPEQEDNVEETAKRVRASKSKEPEEYHADADNQQHVDFPPSD